MIRPTINSNNSYKLTLTWSRSEYYFGWLVCIELCKMSNKLFLFLKYLFLIFIIFQLVILFHGFLFFSADVADVGPLNSDWSDLWPIRKQAEHSWPSIGRDRGVFYGVEICWQCSQISWFITNSAILGMVPVTKFCCSWQVTRA